MSCLNSLLSISDPCQPLSVGGVGYDVTDAVGFSWNRASSLATGVSGNVSGFQVINNLRRLAIKKAQSDIFNEFNRKGWVKNFSSNFFTSGKFGNNNLGNTGQPRGIQIKTKETLCTYESAEIVSIQILSAIDGNVILSIQENGVIIKSIPIELKSMVLKVIDYTDLFDLKRLKGTITISISGNFAPVEVTPTCECNSGVNHCATSTGFAQTGINVVTSSTLGYGIIAELRCGCDYEAIMCQLPNRELLAKVFLTMFEKLLVQSALHVDNYSFYTLYDREAKKEMFNQKTGELEMVVKEYVQSLRTFLNTKSTAFCGCIQCDGTTLKSLI